MRRPDAELVAIDWISADGYFAAVDGQLDWVKMGVTDTRRIHRRVPAVA